MPDVYFEEINKASRDFPYIDLCSVNLNYISHFHEEIELVFISSGETKITVDGNETSLIANDVFIIMPGEIHNFNSISANTLYIMKFYAPAEFSLMRINGLIRPSNEYYGIFRNIVEVIANEVSDKSAGYEYAVNIQANRLMLEIIRTLKASKISNDERKELKKKFKFLNQINDYLETHYSEKILLDEIAAHCHYSKYYFAHMIKKITSVSFINYLTIFRLEKSKELLYSDKSITQISFDCGFNNLRSFNRCFKKYYHMTPLEYRHIIQ